MLEVSTEFWLHMNLSLPQAGCLVCSGQPFPCFSLCSSWETGKGLQRTRPRAQPCMEPTHLKRHLSLPASSYITASLQSSQPCYMGCLLQPWAVLLTWPPRSALFAILPQLSLVIGTVAVITHSHAVATELCIILLVIGVCSNPHALSRAPDCSFRRFIQQ